MRRVGKGDAIPLIAFHNAPLFKAGFFTEGYVKMRFSWKQIFCSYDFPIESECSFSNNHLIIGNKAYNLHDSNGGHS
jgi:hypothetical protein